MTPTEKNLYQYFHDYARRCGDNRFVFDEEKAYTVDETFSIVIGLANKLYALGIRPGTRVALKCTRTVETALVIYSLMFVGALTAMCDPHCSAEEFLCQNEVNFCADAVVETSFADNVSKCFVVYKEKKFEFEFDKVKSNKREFSLDYSVRLPSTVIFTSGSTGKSKAVLLSQYNILNNSEDTRNIGWYLPDDINLGFLPLHHVFGLSLIVTAVVTQHAVMLPHATDVKSILACIQQYRITRMNGVPTLYSAMANLAEEYDLSSLRTGLLGGGCCPKERFEYIERNLHMTLIPVYGMSECIGISCASFTDSVADRCDSVGKVYSMNKVFIVDDKGNEVESGSVGEICVISPFATVGYLDDDKSTAELFDTDGKLHTGDLGYISADGFLHISGRKKDIVIRNGINISCAKIENTLLSFDEVDCAAVVGIPHAEFGEAVCALVKCKKNVDVTVEELYSKLKTKLPKNEIPFVQISDCMPMTSSGKADKVKIKKIFEDAWKTGLC